MALFSRLFGGGGNKDTASAESTSETYKDFTITPCPIKEGNRFRVSARIEREVGGVVKSHTLIRADVIDGRDEAEETSVRKAKQMIDEQGERLFG